MTPSPTKITIDKNIPLPRGHMMTEGRMAQLRSIYTQMVPGDSFICPFPLTHAFLAAKQCGIKITSRKLEKGGFRVWRKS